MKRMICLGLALCLALSFATVSFASPSVITLERENGPSQNGKDEMIKLVTVPADADTGYYLTGPDSGDYYFWFSGRNGNKIGDITVETTGNVSAKLVKYDPKVMWSEDQEFYLAPVKKEEGNFEKVKLTLTPTDAKTKVCASLNDKDTYEVILDLPYEENLLENRRGTRGEYEFYLDLMNKLNQKAGTRKFCVMDALGTLEKSQALVKVTTADNLGRTYEKGSVTVRAKDMVTKENTSATITVISDNTFVSPDAVELAADYDWDLILEEEQAFSAFLSEENRMECTYTLDKDATPKVLPSSAFSEIEGENLTVVTTRKSNLYGNVNTVLKAETTIFDIAKGQKGMNFTLTAPTLIGKNGKAVDKDKNAIGMEFGFKGKQPVDSKAEITFEFENLCLEDLEKIFGMDRDLENTFLLIRDGKEIKRFTTGNLEDRKDLALKVELEEGENLGVYQIRPLTKENSEAKGEETNPETGAPATALLMAAVLAAGISAFVITKKRVR